LVKFKEIKFCLHHSLKILNRVLILLLTLVGSEWDNNMLVSTPNRIGTDLSITNLSKSLIKMRESKGPKTKPWGTPCLTLTQVDVLLSFSLYSNVHQYLLVR